MSKGFFGMKKECDGPSMDLALNLTLQQLWEANGSDPYLYTSSPKEGVTRVVFQGKVCNGYPEARQYALELLGDARKRLGQS